VQLREARAPLPYMAGLSVPYYIYVGRKPAIHTDPAGAIVR